MNEYLGLVFFLLGFFISLGCFLYLVLSLRKKEGFRLLSSYPYEALAGKNPAKAVFLAAYLLGIVCLALVPLPLWIFFLENGLMPSFTLTLFSSLCLLGGGISFSILIYKDTPSPKTHLMVYVISTILIATSSVCFAFLYLQGPYFGSEGGGLALAISCFFLTILSLAPCLDTKGLLSAFDLKREPGADGTFSYVRPKVVRLALYEWLLFLLPVLAGLLSLLGSFGISA